jgi:DNA-binding MarR family transcriptional regulator
MVGGAKSNKKTTTKRGKAKARRKERVRVDTTTLNPLIGYHLRRAMATLIRNYNQSVMGGEIRPGLASLLRLVATNRGASQVDLSRAMQVDKATLVALIDTAEDNGWLRRRKSKVDRRRHEVILTGKGRELVDELVRQIDASEEKFRELFTDKELANLFDYLRRIYTIPEE